MPRLWRVHLPDLALEPGGEFELPAEEAHHVRRVLRLRRDARLTVFDGVGREWRATLTQVADDGVRATIGDPIEDPVECEFEVSLFQGWCEPARMEWVLQKGTELGLSSIHPMRQPGSTRGPSDQRLRRWRRISIEACKQSGRRRLPRIEPLDAPPPPPDDGPLALLLEPGARGVSLQQRLLDPAPPRVWLASGAAEGWGEDTLARLSREGWVPVGLGPRILRAETAGLVAATIVLHRLGDLGTAGR